MNSWTEWVAQFFDRYSTELIWLLATGGGRMIYILYEVKNGLRELWSIKSLVDFMLIVPLALLGWATAKAFGASLEIGIVVSAWVGHVGIRFFDIVEQAVRKALSLDKGKT